MTVTPASLRTDFPEFSDDAAYPDSGITFWLTLAGRLLNADRWGNLLDLGTSLFVAHHIVLERQAKRAADNGAAPGMTVGVINNKSVDKVTVGYDVSATLDPNAGHWNLTLYGIRFNGLVKMIGAGPLQVGVGYAPPLSGPAWPGPYFGWPTS